MVDMCRRSRCVKLASFRIWDFDWSFFWEGSTTSKGCRKLEAVQTCNHKLLRNAFPASIEEEAEGFLIPDSDRSRLAKGSSLLSSGSLATRVISSMYVNKGYKWI